MIDISSIQNYPHEIALGLSIVLTAVSQVLLRLGAKSSKGIVTAVFNKKTFFGYLLFLIVILLMIYSMQKITLRTVIAWNSTTYIFVPLVAFWIAKDPLNRKIIYGSSLIALGLIIFTT